MKNGRSSFQNDEFSGPKFFLFISIAYPLENKKVNEVKI